MRYLKTFEQYDESFDDNHKETLNKTGFWGKQAAGCLIYCKEKEAFLLPLRSGYVLEPYTWGVCGGAMDVNKHGIETPEEAAKREFYEETGLSQSLITKLIPLSIFEKKNENGEVIFKYYNYLAIIDNIVEPKKNWETDLFDYFTFDEIVESIDLKKSKLKPKVKDKRFQKLFSLHFGLEWLFKKDKEKIKIEISL